MLKPTDAVAAFFLAAIALITIHWLDAKPIVSTARPLLVEADPYATDADGQAQLTRRDSNVTVVYPVAEGVNDDESFPGVVFNPCPAGIIRGKSGTAYRVSQRGIRWPSLYDQSIHYMTVYLVFADEQKDERK